MSDIYHYGILGMKWGIRRYQNKDGSLTALGKATYGKDSTKLTSKDKFKTQYEKEGYSSQDANKLAIEKVRNRRAAAIAVGAASVSGAITLGLLYRNGYMDKTIKAGAKQYHLTQVPSFKDVVPLKKDTHLYVTDNIVDRTIYRNVLGGTSTPYRVERTFEAIKDIKIASPNTTKKLFKEFIDSADPTTLEKGLGLSKTFIQNDPGYVFNKFLKMAPYANSTGERTTNYGFVGNQKNPDLESLWKTFKTFSSEKGYSGIVDIDNTSWAFRPTVLFNADSVIKDYKKTQVPVPKGYIRPQLGLMVKPLFSKKTQLYTGLTAATFATSKMSSQSYLQQYRKAHPNSQMSNAEIIKSLNKNGVDPGVYKMLKKK